MIRNTRQIPIRTENVFSDERGYEINILHPNDGKYHRSGFLEIADSFRVRRFFLDIEFLDTAVERAREMISLKLSAPCIAESLEDEFDRNRDDFACVIDVVGEDSGVA